MVGKYQWPWFCSSFVMAVRALKASEIPTSEACIAEPLKAMFPAISVLVSLSLAIDSAPSSKTVSMTRTMMSEAPFCVDLFMNCSP